MGIIQFSSWPNTPWKLTGRTLDRTLCFQCIHKRLVRGCASNCFFEIIRVRPLSQIIIICVDGSQQDFLHYRGRVFGYPGNLELDAKSRAVKKNKA
jgi:hypothetical protein